jgi:hypothetical protein
VNGLVLGDVLSAQRQLREEYHGLAIVADAVAFPGPPHELRELGVADGGLASLEKPERIADVQDAFFDDEAGDTRGQHLPHRDDLDKLLWREAPVEEHRLPCREFGGSARIHAPYYVALRVQVPQRP